jgi:hypothetical protein
MPPFVPTRAKEVNDGWAQATFPHLVVPRHDGDCVDVMLPAELHRLPHPGDGQLRFH